MTSISAAGYSFPLQSLQQQLTKNTSVGRVNSTDQSALSSALDDIDSSLQASSESETSSTGRPSKATLDRLIANEVSSGKLTSDQASQLQGVFGSFAGDESSSSQGSGVSAFDLSSSETSSGTSTLKSSDLTNTLNDFLKLIQNSAVSGYNTTGTTSSSISALLIDIKT